MPPTNITNSVVPSPFQDDTSSQMLSWQSCFWAIVPIALNTMCQPSGRILGYASKYNFALRCSPLVCAASAVDTVLRTIVFWIQQRSFKSGLQKLKDFRFKDSTASDEGSFASLRKNQAFRLILVLPGALPQIVKLYACKGIPWTQACCTAYLASYIVDEITVWLASIFLPGGGIALPIASTSQDASRPAPVYTQVVMLTSFTAAYWLLTLGLRASGSFWLADLATRSVTGVVVCSATLCLLNISLIPLVLMAGWKACSPLYIFAYLGALPLIMVAFNDPNGFDLRYELIIAATAWFLGVTTLFSDEHDVETFLEKVGMGLPRLRKGFLFLHLLAASLYYAHCYNGVSTYKPGWTNWLG